MKCPYDGHECNEPCATCTDEHKLTEYLRRMRCPFCNHELNLIPVKHYNKDEEEYTIGCENCGAIGAIYRKKRRNLNDD